MSSRLTNFAFALNILSVLLAAPLLSGHDPGISTATIEVHPGRIVARIVIPVRDAKRFAGPEAHWDPAQVTPPGLMLLKADGAELEFAAAKPIRKPEEVLFGLEFPIRSAPRLLFVKSAALRRLAAGHRQFVSVRDADGKPLGSCLLSRAEPQCEVRLDATNSAALPRLGAGTGQNPLAFAVPILLAILGFRLSSRKVVSPQNAAMALAALLFAAAPLFSQQEPSLAGDAEDSDASSGAAHFAVVVTATPMDSKVDLRDTARFRNILFSRDDQLFNLLDGGINAGQHEGGGKSLEIRRFGFNLDHGGVGGGLRVVVDEVAQNQGTQGHGQGYLGSLKSLSPELVEELSLIDGPFSAMHGDFSGLGIVQVRLREAMPDIWTARLQYGSYGSKRGFLSWSPKSPKRDALLAYEGSSTDGPFARPLDYVRHNITGNYSWRTREDRKLGLKFNGGTNQFNSAGQIPLDEVAAGRLDRFGALSDSDGGRAQQGRVGFYFQQDLPGGAALKANGYVERSLFDLYSNFTFFLHDPVAGDAIQQHDSRLSEAAAIEYVRPGIFDWGTATLSVGGNWLATQNRVGLWRQVSRDPFSTVTSADAAVQNGGAYIDERFTLANGRLELGAGLRMDSFRYRLRDLVEREFSGSQSAVKLQPKASAAYRFADSLELFFNYGRGIASLDARAAVRRPEGPHVASTDFLQWGSRHRLPKGSTLRVSKFSIHTSNQLVYVPDDGSIAFSGPAKSYGFETKLAVPLTRKLSFDGGITKVLNGYYKKTEPRVYLERAPRFTANAALTLSNLRGWSGAFRLRAINHYPLDGGDLTVLASGHTVADLSVSRRVTQSVEISVSVDNLFNRRYWETQNFFVSRLAGAVPMARIHGTPGYGRRLTVGLTLRLGEK